MNASIVETSPDALPVGTHLQEGTFIIKTLLAVSSFGTTYTAQDMILNRQVVIKEYFPNGCRRNKTNVIPPPDQSDGTQFTQAKNRFLEEARVLAKFRHPGIVGVYNFFEANNTAYMVMEYVQGASLMKTLTQRGVCSAGEVLEIARQLCAALETVHDAGLLHRDIKPDNVIRCDDGRVVLVDFGLSEKFDTSNSRHTRPLDSALRYGTPGYAPLEQYTHSAQLGPASDIYALGATLYHLCSGQMPLPATDRACGVELEAPRCEHPVLAEIIMWAISLELKKRPSSAQVFLQRINDADEILNRRIQIVELLRRHAHQKALAQLAKAQTDSDAADLNASATDDTGCMKLVFFLYLGLWGIATAVALLFLFVRYVLVGG